jgi:hypothetical protein
MTGGDGQSAGATILTVACATARFRYETTAMCFRRLAQTSSAGVSSAVPRSTRGEVALRAGIGAPLKKKFADNFEEAMIIRVLITCCCNPGSAAAPALPIASLSNPRLGDLPNKVRLPASSVLGAAALTSTTGSTRPVLPRDPLC